MTPQDRAVAHLSTVMQRVANEFGVPLDIPEKSPDSEKARTRVHALATTVSLACCFLFLKHSDQSTEHPASFRLNATTQRVVVPSESDRRTTSGAQRNPLRNRPQLSQVNAIPRALPLRLLQLTTMSWCSVTTTTSLRQTSIRRRCHPTYHSS